MKKKPDKPGVDTKYLQLRGQVYYLAYRIPAKLKQYPQFEGMTYYHQNLQTDSPSIARSLRDEIIAKLNSNIVDGGYESTKLMILARADSFAKQNPHLETELENGTPQDVFRSLLTDAILDAAGKRYGVHPDTGHPLKMTPTQQVELDVLANKKPTYQTGLRHIATRAAANRKKGGKSDSVAAAIIKGAKWLCAINSVADMQITGITWNMVDEALNRTKLAGSTKKTNLYGLNQCFKFAMKLEIVPRDAINPFAGHEIDLSDTKNNLPYTKAEIYSLYNAATGDVRRFIHAAATTGCRIDEILTMKPVIVDGIHCWSVKPDGDGKTKNATRTIPMHPSINPADYATPYPLGKQSYNNKLGVLVDRILPNQTDSLSKPRRTHSFRTSVIQELVRERGFDILSVGAVTGHETNARNAGSAASYLQDKMAVRLMVAIVAAIEWNPPTIE
jgi:integrase